MIEDYLTHCAPVVDDCLRDMNCSGLLLNIKRVEAKSYFQPILVTVKLFKFDKGSMI